MEQQPTAIGRYIIEKELGRGHWGVVYRAHDPQLNRPVALKHIPLSDDVQGKRFHREAQIAANLSHPHIVPVYDIIQTETAVCIVMELLTGGTLHQRVTRPLTWQEGVSLLLPVCDALDYAHKQGIVHRDVKPENILFSSAGEIKLVDFGLAFVAGASRLTRDGAMVGTACYAAPEQIRGEPIDGRADVFALAVMLYEVLAGQPLFAGDIHQAIYQIIQAEPVDLSSLEGKVSPLLLESLTRALAKDADRRYTADEFGVALRHCLAQGAAGEVEAVSPPSIAAAIQGRWLEEPPPPRRRSYSALGQWKESLSERLPGLARPGLYVLIVAVVAIFLGLGVGAYRSWRVARQAQAESLNSQGVAYMQQGDLEIAEDLFGQAIRVEPKYSTAHHNLGMAYYVQGKLSQAAEQFQEAIALAPSYASPRYALGRVYDEQNRVEEALRELWHAVELDAGMSEAYNEIGLILNRQERYAEAVTVLYEGLEKGRERHPPYLLKNLGRAYLGLDEPAQAVEHLEVAAARLAVDDALYIETHRLLAQAYEAQGEVDKALQEWRGPLQNEPDVQENIRRLSPPGDAKT